MRPPVLESGQNSSSYLSECYELNEIISVKADSTSILFLFPAYNSSVSRPISKIKYRWLVRALCLITLKITVMKTKCNSKQRFKLLESEQLLRILIFFWAYVLLPVLI